MGRILGTARIPLSILISALLIAGAYALAHGVGSPPAAQASAEEALLNAIAARDSDGDGLPDWEEPLYGTDPNLSDSFRLGVSDGEAVEKGLVVPKAFADIPIATSSPASEGLDSALPPAPAENTLTAAFSKNFLATYLSAKQARGGAPLSQSDINAIADEVLGTLAQSIIPAPNFRSAKDLKVFGTGPDALAAFAASAERVLLKNTSSATTSEIHYLERAIQDGDAAALSHIASVAKSYRDSAVGLAVLPVPNELADTDLALVNALMRLSEITSDFARANTDPLAAMLALYQYPEAVSALSSIFVQIHSMYEASGVSLPVGVPGASFVNLITNLSEDGLAAKP